MPKYDATPLLYKRLNSDRFLNKLDVTDELTKVMIAARTLARNKIKSAFTKARSDRLLLESLNLEQRQALKGIEPRFYSQGSFVYKTQNMPAKNPPQQIDLDDGTYLPIEAMRDAPIISKEIFFKIVDAALLELAMEQGWKFSKKDTCARLEVSYNIHMDFPLYAIPKNRFNELQKAVGRTAMSDDTNLFTESKRYLPEDEIYLARRGTKHWCKSDPMEIRNWFEESKYTHGSILVRTCRYLKAWRDHTWNNGGPSSIALMICTVSVFDESTEGFPSDSSALAAVFDRLPAMLKNDVVNPMDEDETIYPRDMAEDEQKDIIVKTILAGDKLISALNNSVSADGVVDALTYCFGTRIPSRPDWVKHIGTATSATAAVLSTPAIKTSKPDVPPNMTAG